MGWGINAGGIRRLIGVDDATRCRIFQSVSRPGRHVDGVGFKPFAVNHDEDLNPVVL